jgi:GNAT superfamily N-acetyltransferase
MIDVRPATSDDDLADVARIVTTVSPDNPTTVDDMKWTDEHYPGGRRFVAWLDGQPVGAGGAGRMYVYPASFEGLWGNISVLPEHRRAGVGSALLGALSTVARGAGKTMLVGRTTSDREDAIAFLEHRGFQEHERMKVVRLRLESMEPPVVEAPAGIVISSLDERPDLVASVYEVAQEALPDIPGDGPGTPGTLEEFRVRDVDRPTIPPGGFAIAIDTVTDRVVAYANLILVSGAPGVAWHGMTGVARAWRGRGIATAVKRATIAWAIANGLTELEGANDVINAPMRAVNAKLGYTPAPDEVQFRGPLWWPA